MKIVIFICVILLIILIVGSTYAYREIIVRKPPKIKLAPSPNAPATSHYYYNNREKQLTWLENWGYDQVFITNHRGAKLAGYFFKAKEPTNKTVLAIHGYRCDGGFQEYMYFAPMYLEKLGMNLLIVDDYAHHNSEGKTIGFGWKDRLDCLSWCQWLIQQQGDQVEILLQGVSMGAATVLMAAGEESLPSQVKAVVADCGFSSVEKEIKYVMKRDFNLPPFPIYYGASFLSKLFAGYFFHEGNTKKAVSAIKIPVLFFHGDADIYVLPEMAHELYEACQSPKKLIIAPGIGHASVFLSDQPNYYREVKQLIEQAF